MRKVLIVLSLLGVMTGLGAGPALAAGPGIPKNCNEWNELLHINNVRDCNDPGY